MKKLIILGVAAIALLAATAMAGDYHKGADLICNECHVMHYSQSHDYAGNAHQAPLANGPNEYLLRNSVNELCLSCHDGSAHVPDVLGDNSGTATRLAGALNKADGSVTGYAPESGHSLGYTNADYPGKGTSTFVLPADGLECVNCHGPHGSMTSYRNLSKANVTYAIGTNDPTKDVFERDATHQYMGAAGENHYDLSNVDYNEPGNAGSKYADMCKSCHADFHGALGGAEVGGVANTNGLYEEFHRHPAADVNIGAIGGGHSAMRRAASGSTPIDRGFALKAYRVKVLSASGAWGDYGTPLYPPAAGASLPTDLTPSCMSCHKSHGNQNPFGLIYATGSAPIGENGDGAFPDLCKQCHIQGYVY